MWKILHASFWKYSQLSNNEISLNWSIIDEVTTRNITAYFYLAHSVHRIKFCCVKCVLRLSGSDLFHALFIQHTCVGGYGFRVCVNKARRLKRRCQSQETRHTVTALATGKSAITQ